MRNALSSLLISFLIVIGASLAHATNYVVPASNTFASALSATAGDTVRVSAGSYAALTPTGTGNAARPVVWIGSGSVVVTGLTPKSYHRFYGITTAAEVTFPLNGKKIVLDGCTIGGLDMKDADSSSVRNCTSTGTELTVARYVTGFTSAEYDTLEWSTFSGLVASGSSEGIRFGDTADGFGDLVGTDSCRYFVQRFNTFNISQSGTTPVTAAKHYLCPNFTSYANKYTITSTTTGAGDEGNYGVLFRDCSYNLRMKRDTIFINNESGTQNQRGFMFASGMAGNEPSNHSATIDSSYIRVFRGSALWSQAVSHNAKIRYNILRCRYGTPLDMYQLYLSTSDPYIHHNTIMGPQAVYFGEENNTGPKFSNNILWGTSNNSCNAWEAVGGTTDTLSAFSDSNFVYSTTGDSTRAFYKTACSSPRAGAWSNTWHNDTHSYWGNPNFADTSWATLDATPSASSIARSLSSLWTLGHAGALNPVNSTTIEMSAFRASVIDETAGLSLTLANNADSTATVVGYYGSPEDTMAAWVRLPGQSKWYTSLFGLTPGVTYPLRVVATKGATTVEFDTTITTRQAQWWTSNGYGPDQLFISPTGHDTTGDGTYALPYRTIGRAWYVLSHRANYGRGGIIWMRGGTYYSTGTISGGYATPDSMYSIMAYTGETPIIDGADERYLNGSALTWTQIGSTGVWKTYCAAMDSVAGVWTNGHLALKATTPTELHALAGTSPTWTTSRAWYTNGTDSLYIHVTGGASPSAYSLRLLYRQKLLAIYTPYVRVSGITFTHAGGGFPFALQIGTGAGAYRANGSVVDNCTFIDNGKQGIYSHTGSDLNGDSIVVANCTFTITNSEASALGYNATKNRVEENLSGLSAGGSNWLVANCTFTGFVNAVGIGERLNSDSLSISGNDIDFRDNTITDTADDGLEMDYSQGHNFKVYRNVFSGTARGISMAPCYEGPLWVLFNKISNPGWEAGQDGTAFKFGTGGAGHSRAWGLIANNTVWTDSTKNASSVGEAGSFQNKHFRNNIFVGKDTWLPVRNTGSATCNVNGTDFNYNLLWTWGGVEEIADWQGSSGLFFADNWQSDKGFDANGLQANPQFVSTSPSLLTTRGGYELGQRITGISGKVIPLRGLPDIGSSEYVPTVSTSRRFRGWLNVWLHILGRH